MSTRDSQTVVVIAPADLATACGGELQNAAKLGNDASAWVGDQIGRVWQTPGPMTHYNNRGAQLGYYGEVAGRYVDKFLGKQSDTGGTPAGSPKDLSGFYGHMPSYGWKSL